MAESAARRHLREAREEATAERLAAEGKEMRPEDVPQGLVSIAATMLEENGHWEGWGRLDSESAVRDILATVLPMHGQAAEEPEIYQCWCGCQGNAEDHDLAGRGRRR